MPDGLRGLQIDDLLVAIRLFHRNVGRLGAAQDLHRNSRPLTVHVGKAWAVAGKRAGFRGFRPLEDRWRAHCRAMRSMTIWLLRLPGTENSGVDKKFNASPRCFSSIGRGRYLSRSTDGKNRKVDTTRPRPVLQHLQVICRGGVGIRYRRNPARPRHRLDQNVLSLPLSFEREQTDSRDVAARTGE
jgi:hypothetical protein